MKTQVRYYLHPQTEGTEPRAVQELLGHENLSTTQIYTDTDLSYIMRVYDSAHPHARKKPGDDA